MEIMNILVGIHRKGVHLLAFTNSDTNIVTCGMQTPSAIIVYKWKTAEIVYSTSVDTFTQDIFALPDLN
jgi:microtubule-associated protein-like 5